jgi:hypothetical protein
MPKRTRKVASTPVDPTLPKVPVLIDGETYFLCFDLGALAEAESHFRQHGHDINLLDALPGYTLSHVRTLFPCALRKFHPEISFEDAQAMITLPTLYLVAAAVGEAWKASLPEPQPDPTEAVAAKEGERLNPESSAGSACGVSPDTTSA